MSLLYSSPMSLLYSSNVIGFASNDQLEPLS